MFKFTKLEADTLASACQSFKVTMKLDNQRGRHELDQLSNQLKVAQKLNPLGTNFTILKQALKYYREQDEGEIEIIDQLLTRFKGIC